MAEERLQLVHNTDPPISGMSLEQARRSLLIQLQEIRKKYDELAFIEVSRLSDEKAKVLVDELLVRDDNVAKTWEYIAELEGR